MAAARVGSVGLLLCALLAIPPGGLLAEPIVGQPPGWAGPDPSFGPLFGHRPNGIVLQRVPAPDTDTIRWAVSRPSIVRVVDLGEGTRLVRLDRFGRKLDHELRAALAQGRALVLDLRANRGGSLRRMLRVAARFTGPVPDALTLTGADDIRNLAIPTPDGAVWHGPLTVLAGANTLSSGEVLAALLRRFAGATILGERTFGKDYVLRVEPIGQEWRALVPDGRIEVPDEDLAGGLLSDGPVPAALASRITTN